jgi:REP element-mobilizing transposase RayT
MPYDPFRHHQRSIRLPGYDYSSPGAYFVTICAQRRDYPFGAVRSGEVRLSEPGEMITRWWLSLPEKFPHVRLDAFVIMPDHVHGIIVFDNTANDVTNDATNDVTNDATNDVTNDATNDVTNDAANVGADQCVRPQCDAVKIDAFDAGRHTGRPLHGNDNDSRDSTKRATLGAVIQWFKTMTTNEYIRHVHDHGWPPFEQRLWQRNYWEHIIRDNNALNAIRDYINANPARWDATRQSS